MNQSVRQGSGVLLGSALIMLFYGWFVGIRGSSASSFYNATVTAVDLTMKIGGLAILACAAISFAGIRTAQLIAAIISLVCGLIMVPAALYWFAADRSLELLNLVILVVGGFLLADARAGFSTSRSRSTHPGPVRAVLQTPPPEPPHPASIRPTSLPRADEPPPEEGYLAALAKEDEKPPTANYE